MPIQGVRSAHNVEAFRVLDAEIASIRSGLLPPGGPQARPGHSLEYSTLDDRLPGYACTRLDFDCGVTEITGIFTGPKVVGRAQGGERLTRQRDPEAEFERRQSSLRRSKASMRRRIWALGADHMLTLTKRGKFASLDETWDAWNRFARLMRRFYGEKFKYVVVPELHSDCETFHLHAAIKGSYWAGIVRKLWYRALGGTGRERGSDTPGNIDLSAFRSRRGHVASLGRYMSKYLGKGLAFCGSGRRAFAASAGLTPASITRWREPVGVGLDSAYRIVRRLFDADTVVSVFPWHHGGSWGFTIRAETIGVDANVHSHHKRRDRKSSQDSRL